MMFCASWVFGPAAGPKGASIFSEKIGRACPSACRGIFRTSDHRVLMPASLLAGAALALLCNLIARMPGFEGALPVNSVTALIGAPVVAVVLFKRRKEDTGE